MTSNEPAVIFGGAAFLGLVGGFLMHHGFKKMKHLRLIADTPTSKIRSMALGIVELKGKVKAPETIQTPFSHTPCVYYRYEIKEYQVKRDSKGNTRHTWVTVGSGSRQIQFIAKDDTGECYVQPLGADFNIPLKKSFYQKAGLFGGMSTIINALRSFDQGKGLDTQKWALEDITGKSSFRFSRVGDRKYFEYYLAPDENLYVLGTAAVNSKNSQQLYVKKGENQPTFIISDKSEKDLIKSQRWKMIGSFVGGIALILGALAMILWQIGAL